MARIFSLRGGEHEDVQRLLPWYVGGQLDAVEHARVEAHLDACPECQAEVRSERRLKSEVSAMPPAVERDWARLRGRLEAGARSPETQVAPPARSGAPRWVAWAIAAQIVLFLLLGLQLASSQGPAEYRTLAAPAPAAGERIMVMFRPESAERDMRAALNGAGARLVDGPTSTNAYVVELPAGNGQAGLDALRARPAVTAAERLGAAEPR